MDGRKRQSRRGEGGKAGILHAQPPSLIPIVEEAASGLPDLRGLPVTLEVRMHLTVSGGTLHSGLDRGLEVSAASFLLERRMVLDEELLQNRDELRRILVHEMFHFVWRRLGNRRRAEWYQLMSAERARGARGDLGWSAEWRKTALTAQDVESNSRRWRQYVCESFCDTAAWYFGKAHPEHTLSPRYRRSRKEWFERLLAPGWLPV